MTAAERKSIAIAKALVKALARLEADSMNDVENTINDMRIEVHRMSQAVKDVVEVLATHYLGQ